jgi:hypothetical protein
MIIKLTKENLQKCGFDNENIERLFEWDNHASFLFKDTCYYANNIEKKIYTEIDGYRKYYFENGRISFPMDCPDLIPNFFDLALKNYLYEQRLLLNTMFVEADQKEKFVLNEIEKVKRSIEGLKEDLKINIYLIRDNKKNQIDILDSYHNFLKNKLKELNQQIETSKPKLKKSLIEFINNIEDKEAFLLELKIMFPTEQGKSIKAIVLKLVEVQILIYGTKEFLQFYNELKTYFNRDIGTYQSINDVKTVDKETIDTIYKKLNPLITKYKAI